MLQTGVVPIAGMRALHRSRRVGPAYARTRRSRSMRQARAKACVRARYRATSSASPALLVVPKSPIDEKERVLCSQPAAATALRLATWKESWAKASVHVPCRRPDDQT